MPFTPFHRCKEGEGEHPVVPWLEQEQTNAVEPLGAEDETGVVSGIEEHEGAPA